MPRIARKMADIALELDRKGVRLNALSKAILTIAGAAALAISAFPSVASAGEVATRDHRQQARIDRGVANGQLTRGEYDRDEARLDRIERQRRRDLARDGGRLTAGQDARLNRELNRNSNDIYFTKHDRARQPGTRRD